MTEARIYVACLASYNAGKLHGRWIDLHEGEEEARAEIAAMLAESPEPDAEEWAVHDYDLPKALQDGEYPDIGELCERVDEVLGHSDEAARLAYVEWAGRWEGSDYEDKYFGEFDSREEFAREFFEWSGEAVPDSMYHYIDWDSFGRDLLISDLYGDYSRGSLFVFFNN